MAEAKPHGKILFPGPSARGWHRLQLAAECLQKYAWTYEAPGERPRSSSPALAKGSLIHLILAQHYARMRVRQKGSIRRLGDSEMESDWCMPKEALSYIAHEEDQQQYIPLVVGAYNAYAKHYARDEATWQVLAVEEVLSAHIRGKYLLTGRIDLVVKDESGRVWVVDTKTGHRITKRHREYYGISGQLLGYEYLARKKYGDSLAGVIINFVQHGQAPRYHFQRVVVERRPALEAQFEQIVVDNEEAIERMQESGRPYDHWPKAANEMTCFGRYGPCPFVMQCRWGADAARGGNWTWKGL